MQFTFLIASERSGSNLITRLLDGHSEVAGPAPTHLFRRLTEHAARYGDVREAARWQVLVEDAVALLDSRLGAWQRPWTPQALAAAVSERTLPALLRHVYEAEAAARGKTRVFVKENEVHRFTGWLEAFFEAPRYVYLVRDPRDMALSWKQSAGKRGGVVRAAETWREEQAAGLAWYRLMQPSGRIVCLRYEDLVQHPEAALRAVCALLGIGYEPAMLALDDAARPPHHRLHVAEWDNVHRPVMHGNYGKFADALTPDEVGFVEAVCREGMQAFGYPAVQPPVDDLEALRARLLVDEPYEKPAYDAVDAQTQAQLARRVAVLQQITQRPVPPVHPPLAPPESR